MGWSYLALILLVCAVLCAVGFDKFVYFLSIGYGFAVAGGGVTILVLGLIHGWTDGVLWLAVLQALAFVAYGARLSGFLLAREIKNASYRKTLKEATGKGLPLSPSAPSLAAFDAISKRLMGDQVPLTIK